jgi:hypothetical protein
LIARVPVLENPSLNHTPQQRVHTHTHTHTNTHTHTHTHHRNRHTDIQTYRHTYIHKYSEREINYRQPDRLTEKQR